MFGGSPKAVEWFNRVYYTYFYYYLDSGHFLGIDQFLWNSLMFLWPKRFLTVFANDEETMPGVSDGMGPGQCGGWCVCESHARTRD